MVVHIPVGRETNDTVEEITEAEVENQEECWIFCHAEFLAEFLFYSAREEIEIQEGGDGKDVTNCPNNTNDPNDGKHPVPSTFNFLRLTVEICPVGDELRTSAVNKRSANFVVGNF